MNVKLNKIRIDIDEKIQEEIRTDKIHSKDNEVKVKPDKKHEEAHEKEVKDKKDKNSSKEKFIINGFKYKSKSLNVNAEKNKILYAEDEKGNILDTKK